MLFRSPYPQCQDAIKKNKWSKNLATGNIARHTVIEDWTIPFALCTLQQRLPMLFNGLDNPQNFSSHGGSQPCVTHSFLSPHESAPQMTSWSVQPFHAQYISVINTQTDRQTMLCVTSVALGYIYATHAMWPKRTAPKHRHSNIKHILWLVIIIQQQLYQNTTEFLPHRISTVSNTGRRTEQPSSREGLW